MEKSKKTAKITKRVLNEQQRYEKELEREMREFRASKNIVPILDSSRY